jgi:hypothetical protein
MSKTENMTTKITISYDMRFTKGACKGIVIAKKATFRCMEDANAFADREGIEQDDYVNENMSVELR